MPTPGPTPSIKTFTKDSINTLTISGSTDGSGASLDNTNASWYVTVTDWGSGASVLTRTAMTYSGTPGKWTYDLAATLWSTPYDDRYVLCEEFDQTGSGGVLRLTLDFIARASA